MISIAISSILLGLVADKKKKNKSKIKRNVFAKFESKRKKFAIAMLSVFGLFSAIFIVGPFVGFITEK
jgi:hypothetical protein